MRKNKMGFVDGIIPRPENDLLDLGNWVHYNAMVKSWLKNSMLKELLESIRYAKSARPSGSTLRNATWKVMHQGFIKLD